MVIFSELFSFSPMHLVLYLFCSTSNMGPGASGRFFLGSKCTTKETLFKSLTFVSTYGQQTMKGYDIGQSKVSRWTSGRPAGLDNWRRRPEPLWLSFSPFSSSLGVLVFGWEQGFSKMAWTSTSCGGLVGSFNLITSSFANFWTCS